MRDAHCAVTKARRCNIQARPAKKSAFKRFQNTFLRGSELTELGTPDDISNMDARAGANTETDAAGVTIEERMTLSTCARQQNSERYRRDLADASRHADKKQATGTEGAE
ncbi:MAG TPA: hypothetical protein VGJ20_07970 [Xanthobacteraceae bacterium]|jgi:hypothetical protein